MFNIHFVGKGKSRVIAAIIVFLHEFHGRDDFTILFSSELLMEVDKEKYTYLRQTLNV